MGSQIAVQTKIEDVILDEEQPRLPALYVEASEHLDLMVLHIDRHQVNRSRCAGIDQNLIERPDRDLDRIVTRQLECEELRLER